MKKFLLLFMAVLTLVVTARAGDRFTVDNLSYTVISEENKTVIFNGAASGAEKPKGKFIIPQIVANGSTRYMVTQIDTYAFDGCEDLTSVTIPSTVTTLGIGNNLFSNCQNLSEIIVAEDNATFSSFNGMLFDKNKKTLLCCPRAKESVEIPNSVTEIGFSAFLGCSSLTSVTIPNSVIKIGMDAFSGCSGLTSIYCYAINPPALGSHVFNNVNISNVILHVVKGCETAYQEANTWKEFFIMADLNPQPESGIEGIMADGSDAPAEYYNLNGVRVNADNLTPGLYIKRQGGKATKVLVK